MQTWMPEELDYSYGFTMHVVQVKPDGIVDIHYKRPTVTETIGETAESPPREVVDKLNLDFLLTLSPINEIVGMKNLANRSEPTSPGRKIDTYAGRDSVQDTAPQSVNPFIEEVYRLALNTGNFDSALDLAPKLPIFDVKPGDTWKHTVGYSPKQVTGDPSKSAVQRLDYTYAYSGIVLSGGRKVYRVTADLAIDNDVAAFFNQISGGTAQASQVKSIALKLKSHIDFDLDLASRQTIRAASRSTGGISFVLKARPEQPIHEERFKGSTVMLLKGRS